MARSIALFLEWSWLLVSNGKWWTEIRTYMHVGSSELMIYRNRCSRVFSVLESTYWASCWSGKHHQWHISWLSVPSLAYKQSWQLHCSAIHYPIWWVQKWGSNACRDMCIMHVCDLGKEKSVCACVFWEELAWFDHFGDMMVWHWHFSMQQESPLLFQVLDLSFTSHQGSSSSSIWRLDKQNIFWFHQKHKRYHWLWMSKKKRKIVWWVDNSNNCVYISSKDSADTFQKLHPAW